MALAGAGPVHVWQFLRFGKRCISYILAAGGDAIVVDPHRDIEDLRGLLRDRKLTLRGVFDTHLHSDHISGGRPLSEAEGAPYYGSPADFGGGAFAFTPLEDRAVVRLDRVEVTPLVFMPAPGHTPGSTVCA